MRRHAGLLELLHPAGAPGGTAVGGRSPAWLAGEAPVATDADVVLVQASNDNPDVVARTALSKRSETAIVVVHGSWLARRRLVATLAALGLTRTRHGFAVGPGAALGATVVVRSASWSSGHPRAATRSRLCARGLTVCAPAGSPPLAAWLDASEAESIVICPSWRGLEGSVVVRTERAGVPRAVAKLGFGASSADVGEREARAIEAFGAEARAAGARVPELRGTTVVAGRTAAVLSGLPGAPVAQAPRHRVGPAAERVVEWLGRFVARTSSTAPTARVLEDSVLVPARTVVVGLDGGTAYLDGLHALAGAVGAGRIPVAAAHGDLTLWNVLVGEQPGIVDWEGARNETLPLCDLPYLLVDRRTTLARRRGRISAFHHCYPEHEPPLDVSTARALTGLELPPEVVELAFHACWLAHAADEHRRGIDGPFHEILGVLVRRASA